MEKFKLTTSDKDGGTAEFAFDFMSGDFEIELQIDGTLEFTVDDSGAKVVCVDTRYGPEFSDDLARAINRERPVTETLLELWKIHFQPVDYGRIEDEAVDKAKSAA